MNQHAAFDGPNLPATLPDIDAIEAGFNRANELFITAFEKIAEADAAIRAAREAVDIVTPGAAYHAHSDGKEVEQFNKAVRLPERDTYLRVARKLLTLRCWHYVVDRCGLAQLMDAQAKRELDATLRYVPERAARNDELITEEEMAKGPPPFTADNVRATIATFSGNAQMIWRRGIANAFSQLDRRFRSHDGFKVGSRVILTYFADSYGRTDRYGKAAETFRDIERTFHILDGRDPRHAQSNLLHMIDKERKWGVHQSEHENDYLKVRVYKNGNAHLWFTRDDLVEKVNKELAAYYGEVIGDANTKEPDPFENRALTHARLYGFYPTPAGLAANVVAKIPRRDWPQRILEPSAGTGSLAYLAAEPREVGSWDNKRKVRDIVHAIEIQPQLAAALRDSGRLSRVTMADFLQVQPDPSYDGVLMNPPFDRERDIDHVTHALKFLKADGWLLSIMSAGIEFRETRKSAAFRKLLDERNGWMVDIPAGAFAEVGTHVNTVLVGFGASKPWRIDD